MKLVIDISEDHYERIKYMYIHNDSTANEFKNIIMHGVPLMDYLVEHKAKIESQESEEMIKCCVTCKYHHLDGTKEPCASCIRKCLFVINARMKCLENHQSLLSHRKKVRDKYGI